MLPLSRIFAGVVFVLLACGVGAAGQKSAAPARCRLVVLSGKVAEGSGWQASLGRDAFGKEWLMRVVPVPGGREGRSGWDLAASPVDDQNYPDGLLLASPPYGSLNPREIATTYGMRAQDAIAWSPRRFHLFTSAGSLAQARPLYRALLDPATGASERERASRQLLDLSTARDGIASGRLEVLDAHLVSGSADPASFAAQWASRLGSIPHTLDADGGKPTLKGALHGLDFRISLWLPISWNPAQGGRAPVACSE